MVEEIKSLANLQFKRQPGMEFTFTDITVKIKDKTILDNVSGQALPGEILAMMGPTGSGKTTLLNVLAGRHTDLHTGQILVKGVKLCKKIRRKICYVLQEDIFFESLTLKEQLVYSAKLRLSGPMVSKMKKVNEIIDILDIRKCLNTKIGSLIAKGLSGGEKKRANIGCELLTDPAVLLLDEPTSGLDSSTAYTLLSILKNYAVTTRKTVIISVHQPSSSMFYMFDKLLLMHQGETVYFGKANNVVDYFDSIGFQCEQHYNPADFILDKVRGNESEVETIMAASRNALWESYSNGETMVTNSYIDESNNGHIKYCSNENSVNMKHTNDLDDDFDDDSEPKWSTTYFEQYRTLTSRSFKESKSKMLSSVKIVESIVLASLMGIVWFQLGFMENMIDDRNGLIFMSLTNWTFLPMFMAMYTFPGERVVINKERLSGLYRLSAYFLAKQTSELPIGTLIPAMSYVIIYWAGGLNRTWPPAFVFSLALVLLGSLVGQSIGYTAGLLCNNLSDGLTFMTIYGIYTMVTAGYFISVFPSWLKWTQYTSFCYYLYHSMLKVEYTNNKPFICNMEYSNYEECNLFYNGSNIVEIQPQSILDFYQVYLPVWFNVAILVAVAITFRLIAYLLLRYLRKPK